MKQKTIIRKLYDLGSRIEIIAERAIVRLVRNLRKNNVQ